MLSSDLIEQDEQNVEKVDLQKFRREVIERTQTNSVSERISSQRKQEDITEVRIKHEKYGEGTLELEDDEFITVFFDDYGSKRFSEMFTTLEYL